jgi:hypothetical protein
MTSLWSLAKERKQPDFQYMDQETLDQIKLHKPIFGDPDKLFSLSSQEIEFILDLAPKNTWYLQNEIISTIHGISHTIRVMIYAFILAKDNLDKKSMKALLLACALHDTQRQNDKGDEGHEERVVTWFKKNFSDSDNFSLVRDILDGKHNLEMYLRTADALDRYRLPKVKWWIDDSYLQIVPDDSLKLFAFNLVICSEQNILDGTDIKPSITKGLVIL